MEKQKGMARGTDRPGAETHYQICKVPLRKRAFTEHIAKKMSETQQPHPLGRLLPHSRGKNIIPSETKREMKAKDDKMLTLEPPNENIQYNSKTI